MVDLGASSTEIDFSKCSSPSSFYLILSGTKRNWGGCLCSPRLASLCLSPLWEQSSNFGCHRTREVADRGLREAFKCIPIDSLEEVVSTLKMGSYWRRDT